MSNVQEQAFSAYVAAFNGNVTQALLDFARRAQIAVAWIDRQTVQTHIDRELEDEEWSALTVKLDRYDEHVTNSGFSEDVEGEFINKILADAGIEP